MKKKLDTRLPHSRAGWQKQCLRRSLEHLGRSSRLNRSPKGNMWSAIPVALKFHILIYLSPLHKCPIKEGFLTSWGVKSDKKPCRQNYRVAMGIFYCHGLIFKFRPLLVGNPSFLVHLWTKLEYMIF